MAGLRRVQLVRRMTFWGPTRLGLVLILLFVLAPVFWWGFFGEDYLSATHQLPASVLVVEGWIGREGVRAAAREFSHHEYEYVVPTGGETQFDWEWQQSTYADLAHRELVRAGVPETRILAVPLTRTERHRTFSSAVAAWQAIHARGLTPKILNVFSEGPHAARSRLVFAKVFQPETRVGVISWRPEFVATEPWWRSSDRAKELLTETVGYWYEILFSSGRSLNAR